MDRLTSANLGKTFATDAVDVLSRFTNVADGDNPRLELVGLMFMVSESARMNPVRDAIARGWDTGTGFTKQLMTDYVWKYVEMSRHLRHWKRGNYAERRPDSELGDIYLVLNGNPFSLKCAFNPLKYDHFQNIIAFFYDMIYHCHTADPCFFCISCKKYYAHTSPSICAKHRLKWLRNISIINSTINLRTTLFAHDKFKNRP